MHRRGNTAVPNLRDRTPMKEDSTAFAMSPERSNARVEELREHLLQVQVELKSK